MKTFAFLEGDVSEVEVKYKAWIETNVTFSLLENTQMRALLIEYMECFVKSEWKGMNIPALKLEVKDDAPERMFCKPRPISPRLFEAAKKEFRLWW